MKFESKVDAKAHLESLVGVVGTVVDNGRTLIGMMPNREDVYRMELGEDVTTTFSAGFKMEDVGSDVWVLYLNKGGTWIQAK